MGKLLESRLPLAITDVDANIFNRLVRILEINLGKFDPGSTPQFNDSNIGTLGFNAGDVIWNTTFNVLQVYNGNEWIDLTLFDEQGYEATASLGFVSVITGGNISVNIR